MYNIPLKSQEERDEYTELKSRMNNIATWPRTLRQARLLHIALATCAPENKARAVKYGLGVGAQWAMAQAIKRMENQNPVCADELRKIMDEIFEGQTSPAKPIVPHPKKWPTSTWRRPRRNRYYFCD